MAIIIILLLVAVNALKEGDKYEVNEKSYVFKEKYTLRLSLIEYVPISAAMSSICLYREGQNSIINKRGDPNEACNVMACCDPKIYGTSCTGVIPGKPGFAYAGSNNLCSNGYVPFYYFDSSCLEDMGYKCEIKCMCESYFYYGFTRCKTLVCKNKKIYVPTTSCLANTKSAILSVARSAFAKMTKDSMDLVADSKNNYDLVLQDAINNATGELTTSMDLIAQNAAASLDQDVKETMNKVQYESNAIGKEAIQKANELGKQTKESFNVYGNIANTMSSNVNTIAISTIAEFNTYCNKLETLNVEAYYSRSNITPHTKSIVESTYSNMNYAKTFMSNIAEGTARCAESNAQVDSKLTSGDDITPLVNEWNKLDPSKVISGKEGYIHKHTISRTVGMYREFLNIPLPYKEEYGITASKCRVPELRENNINNYKEYTTSSYFDATCYNFENCSAIMNTLITSVYFSPFEFNNCKHYRYMNTYWHYVCDISKSTLTVEYDATYTRTLFYVENYTSTTYTKLTIEGRNLYIDNPRIIIYRIGTRSCVVEGRLDPGTLNYVSYMNSCTKLHLNEFYNVNTKLILRSISFASNEIMELDINASYINIINLIGNNINLNTSSYAYTRYSRGNVTTNNVGHIIYSILLDYYLPNFTNPITLTYNNGTHTYIGNCTSYTSHPMNSSGFLVDNIELTGRVNSQEAYSYNLINRSVSNPGYILTKDLWCCNWLLKPIYTRLSVKESCSANYKICPNLNNTWFKSPTTYYCSNGRRYSSRENISLSYCESTIENKLPGSGTKIETNLLNGIGGFSSMCLKYTAVDGQVGKYLINIDLVNKTVPTQLTSLRGKKILYMRKDGNIIDEFEGTDSYISYSMDTRYHNPSITPNYNIFVYREDAYNNFNVKTSGLSSMFDLFNFEIINYTEDEIIMEISLVPENDYETVYIGDISMCPEFTVSVTSNRTCKVSGFGTKYKVYIDGKDWSMYSSITIQEGTTSTIQILVNGKLINCRAANCLASKGLIIYYPIYNSQFNINPIGELLRLDGLYYNLSKTDVGTYENYSISAAEFISYSKYSVAEFVENTYVPVVGDLDLSKVFREFYASMNTLKIETIEDMNNAISAYMNRSRANELLARIAAWKVFNEAYIKAKDIMLPINGTSYTEGTSKSKENVVLIVCIISWVVIIACLAISIIRIKAGKI